jgi:tetratricopeptide (TPR) repeat protein
MRWFAALLDRSEAATVAPVVRANALRAYGGAADMSGDAAAAARCWEQSLAIFRELGDEAGEAVLLHRLAISAQRTGDLERARELVEHSQRIHEQLGNRWGQAQTLGTLGAIARDVGDEPRAFDLLESSLDLAREARVTWWVSGTQAELANLHLNAGRIDEALACAGESLHLADQMGDRAGRVFGVGLFAGIAAERGQHTLARDLWAAIAEEDAGAPLGGWRRHRERYRDRLSALPASPAESAQPTERTLDRAVALALGQVSVRPKRR